MRKRDQRIVGVRRIAREHEVAGAAAEALAQALRREPDWLTRRGLEQRDLDRFQRNLAATYTLRTLRMFAAFEQDLRDLWTIAVRQTEPPMAQLLTAVATRFTVRPEDLDAVDALRAYRNALVHGGGPPTEMIGLGDARQRICRFLSQLPPEW